MSSPKKKERRIDVDAAFRFSVVLWFCGQLIDLQD